MDYAKIAAQVNAEFKLNSHRIDCNRVHEVFTGTGYAASHPVDNRIKVLIEQAQAKPKKRKKK